MIPRDLPVNKLDLVKLYCSIEQKRIDRSENDNLAQYLDPVKCAIIRDPGCFDRNHFQLTGGGNFQANICVAGNRIRWVVPESEDLGAMLGLPEISFMLPCQKRIAFIEKHLNNLFDRFQEEIQFIFDFTSSIFWLIPKTENKVGNAAFYEVPHCTFFSDLAFFSIPPEIIVPKTFSEYAILENLYHESLHHQMHAFSALCTTGYLIDLSNQEVEFSLDWRDRKFTLLESLHALHVYSSVTPMRLKYFRPIINKKSLNTSLEYDYTWLLQSCRDGLRMWEDLCEILKDNIHFFKGEWKNLIGTWSNQLTKFKENFLEVQELFHEPSN